MKRIAIAVDGATVAIKARKMLRGAGISAKVIKLSEIDPEVGCNHALEIEESDFFAAVSVLRRASIAYRVKS